MSEGVRVGESDFEEWWCGGVWWCGRRLRLQQRAKVKTQMTKYAAECLS